MKEVVMSEISPVKASKESLLARAVYRLCEQDVSNESRRDVNIGTCFANGLLVTVGAVITGHFALPFVASMWIWCAVFALYFWIGRAPQALLGFGPVRAMFEDDHRNFADGALTRSAKTMWLKNG
jgi:hypothetical protein